MGYDMYMRDVAPDNDAGYFRVQIWAMGGLRQVMTAAGVLDWDCPPPGMKLVTLDYSQIELRVLAHLSKDPNLCAAFRDGADVHRRTAAEVFEVPEFEVTEEQRRVAKAVNFGVIYGQTAFGLARSLNIPDDYLDEDDEEARKSWDASTLALRGRRSPDSKKVPGYKFGSNDAWWVQPEECLLIADALEGVTAEGVAERVAEYNADRFDRLGDKAKALDITSLVEAGYLLPTDPVQLEELLGFARELGEYCRRAASQGGFEVC